MAIGFRSVGARTKADVSVSGSPQSFATPLGHVLGDWLLWVVISDDNTGPGTPAGWTRIGGYNNGNSTSSPYAGRPHLYLYHRIDSGLLGSSQSMTFNTNNWPTGDSYAIGFIAAYTGVDLSTPIELTQVTTTLSTSSSLAHPQVTTATPNDWLISVRGIGSDAVGQTTTDSVGTDVARVSEGAPSLPSSPSLALFDSNAALGAGLQIQRTTTSSDVCTYGSIGVTLAVRPASAASAAVAVAGVASIGFAAGGASTTTTTGGWDLCGPGGLPTYDVSIDWNNDGSFNASTTMMTLAFMGTGGVDNATNDLISDVLITYGRDQERQLSPASVGSSGFTLVNASRKYSPEWQPSVLFGNLEPARSMRTQVTWGGTTFPLFKGRIDDFNVKADMADRSVDFTFLDALNDLSNARLSTPVYESMRTGDLVNIILDEVGWTAGRQVDLGATLVKYWWADGTDALTAVQDLVRSEGAPSIAYVAPDGTFVFHDRHHRIQNDASVTSQATFAQGPVFDCATTDPAGLHFTAPFGYAHGWRDIINSVTFDVDERNADTDPSVVWSSQDTINLSNGQSVTLEISGSDPFLDALIPVSGIDYIKSGAGVEQFTLSRTSGASLKITILSVGGNINLQNFQLRATSIPVLRAIKVHRDDPGSISVHGERSYPDAAPWANANDADAIAGAILLRYAQRRPTVQLRVVTENPLHFVQVVSRTIGDRIHITNGEMGLDDDFFIERITHTIQRSNAVGRPPVHSVIFGCEKAGVQSNNPFRFDVRGAGFDQGIFDPIQADNPFTVFVFDQTAFDAGQFGT